MADRGGEQRRQSREEYSRRAVEAAASLAREHGLRVEEPVVLNDLFSLMVYLKPSPVVARVATQMLKLDIEIEDQLKREIDVTTFLFEGGVPVVPPSRELPPGPHERGGFPISFWQYAEPDLERTPTVSDCLTMLPDLHAALRSYPGELPKFGYDIPPLMKTIYRSDDVLSEQELDLIRTSEERLRPFWEGPGEDVQPLHGDAHPGNLIALKGGGLVWIDFEGVCLGPVEWDLATVMDEGAVAERYSPDPEMMARCTELRALEVALSLVAFYDEFGAMEGWDEGLRSMLGMLSPEP